MRIATTAGLAAALLVFALGPGGGLGGQGEQARAQGPDGPLGERAFVLTMDGNEFNGETWPDTPLLEAYEGESLTFLVTVPPAAEMHTFHLHGHPWQDPRSGNTIDTVLLHPGESHAFRVTAGLGDGHAGDWFYHCHVSSHFEEGMWGLLRVYPYTMRIDGALDGLEVELIDDGTGLEGASLQAHLRSGQGPTRAADVGEGQPVDLEVEELGEGRYRLAPDLPADARGQLVITSTHDRGESVARLDLTAGGYELSRDVVPEGDRSPALARVPSALLT